MRTLVALVSLQLVITITNATAQDCPAGPADDMIEVVQDTVVAPISLVYQMVETRLRVYQYPIEVADPERRIFLTAPSAHRPGITMMESYAAYEAPLLQLAVSLELTADSTATVVTHGARALCKVDGTPPDGLEVAIETIFEIAAGAELSNSLLVLTPDERRLLVR